MISFQPKRKFYLIFPNSVLFSQDLPTRDGVGIVSFRVKVTTIVTLIFPLMLKNLSSLKFMTSHHIGLAAVSKQRVIELE